MNDILINKLATEIKCIILSSACVLQNSRYESDRELSLSLYADLNFCDEDM